MMSAKIITGMILLNVVVAVMLDNFTKAAANEDQVQTRVLLAFADSVAQSSARPSTRTRSRSSLSKTSRLAS
eukprot:760622-Hanusia_phi.AAC.5